MNIDSNEIKDFFNKTLERESVDMHVATCVTESLVNASLFGIDSHGVNLFKHYIECVQFGRVKPNNKPSFKVKGAVVTCNANNTFSHYAASELLSRLDNVSSTTGVAFGSIVNSDHIAAVGIHGFNASLSGKMILAFTNADALANSPDGLTTVFGTNPISLVYRNNTDDELLYIDLATTKFSMNRVKNHRRENSDLPYGVARDIERKITTNPHQAVTLEPIGEHKGFALAFFVEMLTSGLNARTPSQHITPMYGSDLSLARDLTHSFMVIDPSFFGENNLPDQDSFNVVELIRQSLSPEQVEMSPGKKEINTYKVRSQNGIPILDEIYKGWKELGFRNG